MVSENRVMKEVLVNKRGREDGTARNTP